MVPKCCQCNRRQYTFIRTTHVTYLHSGPDYLKRLCKDRDGDESVKILSASEVNAYLVEDKEVSTWITGVKQYLMEGNGQLISQKKLVFFIESQVFLTNTIPKRPVSVMVRYISVNFLCFVITFIWCTGNITEYHSNLIIIHADNL